MEKSPRVQKTGALVLVKASALSSHPILSRHLLCLHHAESPPPIGFHQLIEIHDASNLHALLKLPLHSRQIHIARNEHPSAWTHRQSPLVWHRRLAYALITGTVAATMIRAPGRGPPGRVDVAQRRVVVMQEGACELAEKSGLRTWAWTKKIIGNVLSILYVLSQDGTMALQKPCCWSYDKSLPLRPPFALILGWGRRAYDNPDMKGRLPGLVIRISGFPSSQKNKMHDDQ
ncbi:hypothetical protein BJV74DRAFT_796622 [Russula compacta]|nr:hypothetical protein BJV74DRAFT_796622 [Russula compacta]